MRRARSPGCWRGSRPAAGGAPAPSPAKAKAGEMGRGLPGGEDGGASLPGRAGTQDVEATMDHESEENRSV